MNNWHPYLQDCYDLEKADLTKNQREGLILVAKGWDNTSIAKAFGVSKTCLEMRLHQAYNNIGINHGVVKTSGGHSSFTRTRAVIWAFKQGLVKLEED